MNEVRGRREVILQVALVAVALLLVAAIPPDPSSPLRCGFHRLTGYWCPGCGSTRAMRALTRGEVSAAFRHNPLLAAALPLVLGCWLRSLAARWRGQRPIAIGRVYLWLLATVVVAFWVLRNLPHPLFAWLAPG